VGIGGHIMECRKEKAISLINQLIENTDKDISFPKMYELKLNQNVQVVDFVSKINGKTGKILVGNHRGIIIIDVLADSSEIRKESTPQVVLKDIKNGALNEIVKWLKEY
jgi:hypothetical protein